MVSLSNKWKRLLVGQDHVVDQLAPYVETAMSPLAPEGRPAGVFMLLGPTGTGKTRTVETLAEILHEDPRCMVKIDCGELQLEHQSIALVGSPPSFIGQEVEPLLSPKTLKEARSSHCKHTLVLFDELEKAHPAVRSKILAVLDKATLRTNKGVTDFTDCFVFMTSNIGGVAIDRSLKGSTYSLAPISAKMQGEERAMEALKREFAPEFLNRIDVIVPYSPLTYANLREILLIICEEQNQRTFKRIGENAFRVTLDNAALDWIVERSLTPGRGARELKRTYDRLVTHRVTRIWAEPPGLHPGEVVLFTVEDGELIAKKNLPIRTLLEKSIEIVQRKKKQP